MPTKLMSFMFFVISLLCVFCSSKNKNTVHIKYYKDVDMYNLIGIGEVSLDSQLEYPYLSIDSINSTNKKIVFYYNKTVFYEKIYKKSKNYWFAVRHADEKIDEDESVFYEFILNNMIITLAYKTDIKGRLSFLNRLSIYEENKHTSYVFNPGEIKFKPSPDVDKIPVKKSRLLEIAKLRIQNSVLEEDSQVFEVHSSRKIAESKICYKVNQLSYFWWLLIGHKMERVACE